MQGTGGRSLLGSHLGTLTPTPTHSVRAPKCVLSYERAGLGLKTVTLELLDWSMDSLQVTST